MPDYKKLYAYLMGEIDKALTLMDTGDLLVYDEVRKILNTAVLEAEERVISAPECEGGQQDYD